MNFQNQAVTVASATTAATNMATLLQKNLKTLPGSNSVVVVANGISAGNLSGIGQLTTAPMSASTAPTTFLTGQPMVGVVTAGGTTTTRMLLPHELGSITTASYLPVSSASSTNSTQLHQHQPHQLHQSFQFHNQQQLTQQQQQQFIVYNHSNDVTTIYRPIQTLSNPTTIYQTQAQHLNNQHQQTQQQQQFITQQHSIPKPLEGAIQLTNFTPTTSSYGHFVNGYTVPVLPGSTAAVSTVNSSSTLASHPIAITKTIASAKTLPANGTIIGSSQLTSVNLVKQNGITTDGNNALNHPTSTSVLANSLTNLSTTPMNTTPVATQAIETNVTEVPTADGVEEAALAAEVTVSEADANCGNAADGTEQEPEPEIDIVINNVVCSFSVRCHLNLRDIALRGKNVEFRRENGMVTMKLRRPYTTASIWSSGRITCTGATSEDQAKVGARRYARLLQTLGFPVKFNHFRVVNVLGTCSMPWGINIINFSERFKKDASYEPELHPGVTYKLKVPKATLKIFSTGSITVTAGSVAHVQAAIEHIYPLIYEFRKKRAKPVVEKVTEAIQREIEGGIEETSDLCLGKRKRLTQTKAIKRKCPFGLAANDPAEDAMYVSDVEDADGVDDDDGED